MYYCDDLYNLTDRVDHRLDISSCGWSSCLVGAGRVDIAQSQLFNIFHFGKKNADRNEIKRNEFSLEPANRKNEHFAWDVAICEQKT